MVCLILKSVGEVSIVRFSVISFEKTCHCTSNPFTGHNPHSVIILNNCNIHHTAKSVAELKKYGSLVHFLPPYSPDYNLIENIFAKAKKAIKLLEDFTC